MWTLNGKLFIRRYNEAEMEQRWKMQGEKLGKMRGNGEMELN